MTLPEIEQALSDSHQAVLSVSRPERGPVAVPMSFLFVDGVFKMITMPDSLHGRLITKEGRATVTIHHDLLDGPRLTQWYVMAEGPIEFTDEDPTDLLRDILLKDRGADHLEEWTRRASVGMGPVAVLTPARLSGYISEARLE